mgnify:CR=1 FL=1
MNSIPLLKQYASILGVTEKTDIRFNVEEIRKEIDSILSMCGVGRYRALNTPSRGWTLNLSHLPEEKTLPEEVGNHIAKFTGMTRGNEPSLVAAGYSTADLNVLPPEVANGYLGEVYRKVVEYHNTRVDIPGTITRFNCVFVAEGGGYQLHKDMHTSVKYHIPVWTNKYSFFAAEHENEIKWVHMPADGALWILDTQVPHLAMNISPNTVPREQKVRAHLIIASTV